MALVIPIDKDLENRIGVMIVKRKAQTRPIKGATKCLKLIQNDIARLLSPFPDAINELIAAQFGAA